MKKIIILIILMISLTGCEAVYNLDISNNTFTEELILTTTDKSTKIQKNINVALKSNIPVNDEYYKPEVNFKQNNLKYYEITKIDTNNEIGVRYQTELTKDEYSSSTIVKEHAPSFKINEVGNIISLNLGNKRSIFENYPDLDKLTINITINNKVSKNNADSINGNTYTWNLTKDNYKTKEIYINYNKKQQTEETTNKPKINLNIIFIIIGTLLIGIILYILIKAKNTGK